MGKQLIFPVILAFMLHSAMTGQPLSRETGVFHPLTFEQADRKADSVLALMTPDEKLAYVGGDRNFFIRPIPRLNIREVYLSDATQGVHLRTKYRDVDLSAYQLKQSTAFPCPLALAATWDPGLSFRYAEAVGEECRAGGIGILLGPGLNTYRQSQCGRNFEYFGEDPFLRARLIEAYVRGVQSTGTVATLKHFVANNTDYFRRKSNSVVDERTLHEIYLPGFKAGVDAGVKAVMTSYNLLNGEYCGESDFVINNLLRKQLGFTWLVMTDWWSVHDGERLAKSGQDLEMPQAVALKEGAALINEGKVKSADIDRMAKSILRTYFAMRLNERERDATFLDSFGDHEQVALQTAREAIVLLKNEKNFLPLSSEAKNILLTGNYVEKMATGGGSAAVAGYNNRLMLDELNKQFGERIHFVKDPTIAQITSADAVICNVGTDDSEGWDRPFALPDDQEKKVRMCVDHNPGTIVVVTSGSGIRMTDWNDKARAIMYCWYGGQTGNTAVAEIVAGKTNPSGKLPITIEREFSDSPGSGYVPTGETLYAGWNDEKEKARSVYDVTYTEGILVGYRWYETKAIAPLYAFGHGLSYSTFEYGNLSVSRSKFGQDDTVTVSFSIKNAGLLKGEEIAQLYIQDVESSVPRPVKELKGFRRVGVEPGQSQSVQIRLSRMDFSFWSPATRNWFAEKGKFVILVGSSSQAIRLTKEIELR